MKNTVIFDIDPIETPFSSEAVMLILGLSEATYLRACKRGALHCSIEYGLVKAEVIRHHNFYDILRFSLQSHLAVWKTKVTEDDISDLIEIAHEIINKHITGDIVYYGDYVFSNLEAIEKLIIEQVLKVWSLLGRRISIEYRFTKEQKKFKKRKKYIDPRQLDLFE